MMLFYNLPFVLTVLLFILNLTLSVTIIFLERKTPQSTWAWLLFVWVIPIVGFVFYLFLAQNLTKRKIYRYNTPESEEYQRVLRSQKKAILDRQHTPQNEQLLRHHKNLIDYHANVAQSIYTDNNAITLYTDGHAKFDALFEAIENARDSVHLEYYIVKNDDLGRRLMALLTRKAKEGLQVRLLVDEMGGRYIPQKTIRTFKEAGGAFGIFFPSRLPVNIRLNYRDHRKIAVIDGKIGFVGGFNIGDEYLGLKKKMGYWRDTHLKIEGFSVYELQMRFFLDWRTSGNHVRKRPNVETMSRYFPDMQAGCGTSGVQIVSSGPDNPNQIIKQGFIRMITNAEKYIFIQSPYFVTDESIMEALRIALLSGVEVRIMIPNKPDHVFIYWATLSYVGELIDYGAKVYIYDNGFLHAKVVIVDDQIAAVGSCNFDIRSFSLNFETNAFIYDPEVAVALKEQFFRDIEKSIYYDHDLYENRSRFLKIRESVSRLFAPVL